MYPPAAIPKLDPLPEGVDPLAITKGLAAAYHPQIINDLAFRAGDHTISTTSLLAISEHLYKVSGLSGKQEAKAAGPGFSIQIVLGGGSPTEKTITIGAQRDLLDDIPTYLLGAEGNLSQIEELFA